MNPSEFLYCRLCTLMTYEALMKQTVYARYLTSEEACSHVSRQEDGVCNDPIRMLGLFRQVPICRNRGDCKSEGLGGCPEEPQDPGRSTAGWRLRPAVSQKTTRPRERRAGV